MNQPAAEPTATTTFLALRHGQVASHRGDIPITDEGERQARDAGRWFAGTGETLAVLLSGSTQRTILTARGFRQGFVDAGGTAPAGEPEQAYALRNPDLYLGGRPVNMVSTAANFVEQVPRLTEADVTNVPFYKAFLHDQDRVGYWLAHRDPPGDTAHAVGRRLEVFVRSLADNPVWTGATVIGVTHSPVLRAIALTYLGVDPGEPRYLHGYRLSVTSDGSLSVQPASPS